jgi:hypothetical protein
MGASLARLEARIVPEETLARFPEWDIESDKTDMVHRRQGPGILQAPLRAGCTPMIPG